MATESKRESTPLNQELANEPYRFDFFQAVRIFQHMAWQESRDEQDPHQPIGFDYAPEHEVVRFRTVPSHRFPSGAISSLQWQEPTETEETRPVAEMVIPFLGLTGPSGVLPQHYTQLMIDRVRMKDYSLRDYFDLFNHRVIALFYRAWQKYRFHIQFEEATCRTDRPNEEDDFTKLLYSMVGLGESPLRERLTFDDVAWTYYGGFFSRQTPTVISLTSILEDYFGLDVDICQFQGQWLYLELSDQSMMPASADIEGQNNLLGTNVVVGDKVWSIENKFRVRVGPVGYQQFLHFMPTGKILTPLCQMVRSYVGPEFDFDIQPVLRAEETPWCKLGDESDPSYLGWNTWLRGDHQPHDVDDAVFEHSGDPLA